MCSNPSEKTATRSPLTTFTLLDNFKLETNLTIFPAGVPYPGGVRRRRYRNLLISYLSGVEPGHLATAYSGLSFNENCCWASALTQTVTHNKADEKLLHRFKSHSWAISLPLWYSRYALGIGLCMKYLRHGSTY